MYDQKHDEETDQHSPLMVLYLPSIRVNYVISESYYKGIILQRNYRKYDHSWSFSYNSSVKFHG